MMTHSLIKLLLQYEEVNKAMASLVTKLRALYKRIIVIELVGAQIQIVLTAYAILFV